MNRKEAYTILRSIISFSTSKRYKVGAMGSTKLYKEIKSNVYARLLDSCSPNSIVLSKIVKFDDITSMATPKPWFDMASKYLKKQVGQHKVKKIVTFVPFTIEF